MANLDATSWDITDPSDSDVLSSGAKEIRLLRAAVGVRSDKEHVTLATSSAGGEHLEGSAKAYRQASAPTQRPDASTSLDSDDDGRIWIDSDNENFSFWNGSAWTDLKIKAANLETDAVETAKIKDANVTLAKMAAESIDSDQYVNASIDNEHLADNAVDSAELAVGSVDLAHLATEIATRFNAIEIGSYSGTGASNTISGLSFSPEVLIIIRCLIGGNNPMWGIAHKDFNTGGDSHFLYGYNAEYVSGAITFGSNQFILTGNNAELNSSGVTYRYIALKTNTS